MMNRRRPILVLMIDDDPEFASSLVSRALKYQVIIHYKQNLKDGLDALEANSKYQAIILDGKAPIDANQLYGTESENFVFEAILKLKEIELTQGRLLPYCVLTAWSAQLENALRDRAKIFDKKQIALSEHLLTDMFEYLHEGVAQLEETRIIHLHPEIFDFASKYLDNEDYSFLMALLMAKPTSKREQIIEKLAFLRRLEESLLNIFCKEVLQVDPLLYGLDGQSRTKDLIELVKNRKLAPLHISFLTYVIYTTLSAIVQHKAPENSEYNQYPVTSYTLQTFTGAMLEMILWVKESIEKGPREGSLMADYLPPQSRKRNE